jgi:hypothetical protein
MPLGASVLNLKSRVLSHLSFVAHPVRQAIQPVADILGLDLTSNASKRFGSHSRTRTLRNFMPPCTAFPPRVITLMVKLGSA